MTTLLLALSVYLGSPLASLQQDGWSETSFHRIYLRNGNFIDGRVIADQPTQVTLLLRSGEMEIKRDQIDRVEIIKMRSWNEKPIVIPNAPKATPATPGKPSNPELSKAAVEQTPIEIRKKVDIIVYKTKMATGDDRVFPIEELKALGDEAAVYLASRITGLDAQLAGSAGTALKVLAVEKTIPILEDLLGHPNAAIRLAAAVGLSFQGDAARAKYIRPLLRDADMKVRQAALSLIGSGEDRDWFEPLCDLGADPSREVRTQALMLATRMATKFGLQEKMAQTLVRNMKDSDDGVRADAAASLGGLGRHEDWPSLSEALRDSESKVRASAAQGLTQLAVPDSGPDIVVAIRSETDKWARIYLAGAVQRLRLTKAIEPVIGWLSETDEDLRKVAELTLANLTGEKLGADRAKWEAWLQANPQK